MFSQFSNMSELLIKHLGRFSFVPCGQKTTMVNRFYTVNHKSQENDYLRITKYIRVSTGTKNNYNNYIETADLLLL